MQPLQKATPNDPENLRRYLPNDYYNNSEWWMNDTYTVIAKRNQPTGYTRNNGSPVLVTWLSIKRNDRAPLHDWRDLQWIKNQLVGEEHEGVELFPAESRLVDGANQYHLWVFQNPKDRFPFGFNERNVTETQFFNTVQRPFPENRKPHDLKENELKITQLLNDADKNSPS